MILEHERCEKWGRFSVLREKSGFLRRLREIKDENVKGEEWITLWL